MRNKSSFFSIFFLLGCTYLCPAIALPLSDYESSSPSEAPAVPIAPTPITTPTSLSKPMPTMTSIPKSLPITTPRPVSVTDSPVYLSPTNLSAPNSLPPSNLSPVNTSTAPSLSPSKTQSIEVHKSNSTYNVKPSPSSVSKALSNKNSINPVDESTILKPLSEISPLPEEAQRVLDFWFGPAVGLAGSSSDKAALWFSQDPENDRQIRNQFEGDIRNAISGQYDVWRSTPRGRLALILLLDQFPRHIYRNESKAFAFDSMARGLALEGLQVGDDKKLYPIERVFFYMPLEHAENLEIQNLSVKLYAQLVNEVPAAIKPQMEAFLRYAIIHKQTIARFNRFPHRNKVLGREPTPEEMIYMNLRETTN